MALFTRPNLNSVMPSISNDATDTTMAYQETDGLQNYTSAETKALGGVIGHVQERYQRAMTARRPIENRWLQAYRNYRGFYGPDTTFLETERSRVFIKVTKTKVLAAYSQIMDVLFSGDTFPIGVEPRRLPDGIASPVVVDTNVPAGQGDDQSQQPQAPESPYGHPGDGKQWSPGQIIHDIMNIMPGFGKKAQQFEVKQGEAVLPGQVSVDLAEIAAKKMEKKVQDQLDSTNASILLRQTAFECVLFGTGYMKGPLNLNKMYPNWDDDGNYTPQFKEVPILEAPSIWNIYNDPDAKNAKDWAYVIERHKLDKTQLRELKKRPYFNKDAIEEVISMGYSYTRQWWEPVIQDLPSIPSIERFEVLEYWGMLDREDADRQGLEIPKEYDEMDEIPVNVWTSGNVVLRLVLNPFATKRIPYYAVPYEIQPYTTWGVGLAENMSDTQDLMNGFMRMSVDNGVMSGSLIFEINESNLIPGQDKSLYPGKIFYTNGTQAGQSIYPHEFPNITQENLAMFDKARELADEATGVPSITHGNSQISPGLGRTASGISMIMGAASGNIRTIVKNFDDYLFSPLGEALFAWNMQFNFDPSIKGDLEIISRGTESLMRNEVRSQRLTTFLQVGSNPALAPFVKFPYILREISKSLDLDPDKCTNTNEEAMLQAEILKHMQAQMAPPGQQPNGQPQPGGSAPANGPQAPQGASGNGGGTIGTGQAPGPGAPGNSNPSGM